MVTMIIKQSCKLNIGKVEFRDIVVATAALVITNSPLSKFEAAPRILRVQTAHVDLDHN